MIATMIAVHVPTALIDPLIACHLYVVKVELSAQDAVDTMLTAW